MNTSEDVSRQRAPPYSTYKKRGRRHLDFVVCIDSVVSVSRHIGNGGPFSFLKPKSVFRCTRTFCVVVTTSSEVSKRAPRPQHLHWPSLTGPRMDMYGLESRPKLPLRQARGIFKVHVQMNTNVNTNEIWGCLHEALIFGAAGPTWLCDRLLF